MEKEALALYEAAENLTDKQLATMILEKIESESKVDRILVKLCAQIIFNRRVI